MNSTVRKEKKILDSFYNKVTMCAPTSRQGRARQPIKYKKTVPPGQMNSKFQKGSPNPAQARVRYRAWLAYERWLRE